MSSEEKLEQSTIVKERGTMYFKVSLPRGPEHAPEDLSPSGPEPPGQAGGRGWAGRGFLMPVGHRCPQCTTAGGHRSCAGCLSLPPVPGRQVQAGSAAVQEDCVLAGIRVEFL